MKVEHIISLSCVLLSGVALAQDGGASIAEDDDTMDLQVPSRLLAPPLATAKPIAPSSDVMALATRRDDGVLVFEGKPLTIDSGLQKELLDILKLYQTPWAAAVVLEVKTGRVLAMVEYSEVDPAMRGLCTRPLFPAASVFKLVTSAALLEQGIKPDEQTCFHGGKRKVPASLLEDSPADSTCQTMGTALAKSSNLVFAKLTKKHLDTASLARAAKALHFNREIPFPEPTSPSMAAIPPTQYELALTGAGFGDVFMSPLHGAALALTIGNQGTWRTPILFEGSRSITEAAIEPEVAAQLTSMMALTISEGTARRAFHERGFAVPDAAGKTGALADKKPFRDYTWFVGFAPKDAPTIAVATVIVNDPHWRIRAAWLGREALRLGLKRQEGKAPVPAAVLKETATPRP